MEVRGKLLFSVDLALWKESALPMVVGFHGWCGRNGEKKRVYFKGIKR
jgi:hypothetical protein